jgi:hypothetical protein
MIISVAYLLHARTVESQKLRNTVHYATMDEAAFSPCRAEPHRTLLSDSCKHSERMQAQH